MRLVSRFTLTLVKSHYCFTVFVILVAVLPKAVISRTALLMSHKNWLASEVVANLSWSLCTCCVEHHLTPKYATCAVVLNRPVQNAEFIFKYVSKFSTNILKTLVVHYLRFHQRTFTCHRESNTFVRLPIRKQINGKPAAVTTDETPPKLGALPNLFPLVAHVYSWIVVGPTMRCCGKTNEKTC